MTELGAEVKVYCNSCHRSTNHTVKGSYTHPPGSPDCDPFPPHEEQALRRSVDWFLRAKLEWHDAETGWAWLLSSDDRSPEDDIDGAVEDMERWLENDGNLEQDLWHDEMVICKLLRQNWRWIDIVRACQFGLERQERWEIVKCNGCSTPSLRLLRWSEADDVRHPETGQLLNRFEHPEYFPPRAIQSGLSWILPTWRYDLPEDIQRLLKESYEALNEVLLAVGSMGIRSVVEIAMVEFVGQEGGFEKKLQRLIEQRMITDKEGFALSAVIEFGHAAVHRQHNPTSEDVQTLIDLVEMFLRKLFVMPKQASELQRKTPPRP